MKKQQKQAKGNLQETQDRKHKKIPNGKNGSQFKNSPRHEEVKSTDRIWKNSRAKTLNFDAYNEVPRLCSKVSVFKELINSCP